HGDGRRHGVRHGHGAACTGGGDRGDLGLPRGVAAADRASGRDDRWLRGTRDDGEPFGSDLTATGRMAAMRWLRVLAAAFAAVVVLVLFAAVHLATLDLNAYKREIQAAIQDALGRPVEIEG